MLCGIRTNFFLSFGHKLNVDTESLKTILALKKKTMQQKCDARYNYRNDISKVTFYFWKLFISHFNGWVLRSSSSSEISIEITQHYHGWFKVIISGLFDSFCKTVKQIRA